MYTKLHFSMRNQYEENERKVQIVGIFQSPRAITLTKVAQSYPKQNLPRQSHDESAHQISFQYVQPMRRKWTETADGPTDRQQQSNMPSLLRKGGGYNKTRK